MIGYDYSYDFRINGRTYARGFAEDVDELIYWFRQAAKDLDNAGSVQFDDRIPTNDAIDAVAEVMRQES